MFEIRKIWKSFITSERFFFPTTFVTAYAGANWMQENYGDAMHLLMSWWVVFLAITTLFLIMRTLGLNHLLAPKIKCAFSMDEPGCVHKNTPMSLPNGSWVMTDYYRLKVSAASVGLVPDCRGHLVSITRQNGEVIFRGENLALTFAPATDPNPTVKTLRDAIPEYLDTLFISHENRVVITTEGFRYPTSIASALEGISTTHGNYIFDIVVSSSISASKEVRLLLNWTGDKNTSHMSLIK